MSRGRHRAVVLLALVAATAVPAARHARPIRGVEGLARAYDFILEARFDQADAELRRACGPAPPEACDVLNATAIWWKILLDPESREETLRNIAELKKRLTEDSDPQQTEFKL